MDEVTKREIDKVTGQLLEEAGLTMPPIKIERLLEYLQLYREFYDLEDPTILQQVKHKIMIGKQKFVNILKKVKLVGLWLPDREHVLIDSSLPKPKRKWATFHETTHSVLPWHRPYFMGDTAQTLDPAIQEILESEANYGASALMFGGSVFTQDALDTSPRWRSIDLLKNQYGTSFATTLRRFVEHSHDLPMAMMISTPWWQSNLVMDQERCRHFVGSKRFMDEFSGVCTKKLILEIASNTTSQTFCGIVGRFEIELQDCNKNRHVFSVESFFNYYDLLTFIVHKRQITSTGVVVPTGSEILKPI